MEPLITTGRESECQALSGLVLSHQRVGRVKASALISPVCGRFPAALARGCGPAWGRRSLTPRVQHMLRVRAQGGLVFRTQAPDSGNNLKLNRQHLI